MKDEWETERVRRLGYDKVEVRYEKEVKSEGRKEGCGIGAQG